MTPRYVRFAMATLSPLDDHTVVHFPQLFLSLCVFVGHLVRVLAGQWEILPIQLTSWTL